MSSEIKVGLLFFLGIVVLVWLTLFITRIPSGAGAYAVHFTRIKGLKEGDPVSYNGVRVGAVTTIAAVVRGGAPVVRVTFSISAEKLPGVLVDARTRYSVNQALFGGSELEILSAGGEPITPELVAAAAGRTPVGIDETLDSVRGMVEENRAELSRGLTAIRTAAENFAGMAAQVRDLVAENRPQVQTAIGNVAGMAGQVRDTVAENRATIAALLVRLEASAKEIQAAAGQIGGAVAENRPDLRAAMASTPAMTANIAAAAAEIRGVVAENRDDLRTIIAAIASAAPKLDRVLADVEAMTRQTAAGKGSIGKLVFEDDLYRKAEGAVDNLNQRIEEVKPVTGSLSDLRLWAGVDAGMNTSSGVTTYGAFLRLEPRPYKFYAAGVSYRTAPSDREASNDDPDKLNVDFNLLFGWRFLRDDDRQTYGLTVAGGLIDSQVGGVVQVPITSELSMNALGRRKDNTREPDDRRYEEGGMLWRAWAEYRFWRRISVRAGVDDINGDNRGLWLGVRGEIQDNDLRNVFQALTMTP